MRRRASCWTGLTPGPPPCTSSSSSSSTSTPMYVLVLGPVLVPGLVFVVGLVFGNLENCVNELKDLYAL